MAAQFIGSVISLISKSDIRYQGVLHSIDPQAATVSLEKVRSLGTEGRKSNPAEEVGPSDNVYDFIVFRASDVKDLQIEAPAASTPASEPAMSDPAIVGTAAPAPAAVPAQTPSATSESAPPAAATLSPPKPAEPSQPSPQQRAQQPPQSPYNMPPPHMGQGPFGHYPPPPFGSPFGGPPPPFSPYGAPYPPFGAPGPFGGPGFPPGGPGSPFMQGPPPMHLQQPPQQQQDQALKSPSATSAAAPSPSVQKQQTPAAPAPLASPGAAAEPVRPAPAQPAPAAPATPQETRPETNGYASQAVPSSGAESQSQGGAPKKQAADIEQLAKDMSRASVTANGSVPPQQQQPQQYQAQQAARPRRGEDHVGASIFGGPASHRGAQQPRTQPGRTLQPFGAPPARPTIAVPDTDFDFASSNASFQKPSSLPEAPPAPSSNNANANGGEQDDFVVPPRAGGSEAPSAEASYNPSKSFFDSISSDAKTRNDPFAQQAAGRHGGIGGGGYSGGRYDRERESQKNLEAFGESGAHLGRGGYRRGGGGGGRGRRGGYQSGGGQRQYNNGPRSQQQQQQ
ncbi:hypothetical protein JCM11491_004051 [Sporobolomyces phaffii]